MPTITFEDVLARCVPNELDSPEEKIVRAYISNNLSYQSGQDFYTVSMTTTQRNEMLYKNRMRAFNGTFYNTSMTDMIMNILGYKVLVKAAGDTVMYQIPKKQ